MRLLKSASMAGIAVCLAVVQTGARGYSMPMSPGTAVAIPACDRVRFFPARGAEQAMVGGRFLASNGPDLPSIEAQSSAVCIDGFKVLAEIQSRPAPGRWTELTFANSTPYRWLVYAAPLGSHGRVAEIEFYAGQRKLSGRPFDSFSPHGAARRATDGNTNTEFNAQDPDHQFAGLDIGVQATAPVPDMSPLPGEFNQPQTVVLTNKMPRAAIRYTLDGTLPSTKNGEIYKAPIAVHKTTTICAVAFVPGSAPTPPATGTYIIGRGAHRSSLHVGNSLTQVASAFNQHAVTAGYVNDGVICGIGGAWTKKLWEAATTDNPAYKDYKTRWDKAWVSMARIDHFTMQPRDFDIAEEAAFDIRFMNLVRGKSPQVQPWLYIEWTEMARKRPTDLGTQPTRQMRRTWPAATWEESMAAMVLYGEDLRQEILDTYRQGKPPRVLPTALAMGWLHRLIEEGKCPGISPREFYPKLFRDDVHPNTEGAFLVECTWFAAWAGESPEGKFLPIRTNLTAEQARLMQRLAWDVVKNYPDCGLYEEGAAPCGKPEFVQDGKTVLLKSATPGTWFRYTLDGTPPTRTRGYVYCGVISLQPGMTLKAVAYKSGMADSAVAEMPPPKSGAITAALQSSVDKGLVAGAVALVADRDEVVDIEAVGYSSLANKTPMRTDSLFWIASMSKSITASALMMLVDEGKVHADDPVEKYLPEFKGQQVAGNDRGPAHPPRHPITVKEIMSHTSGLVLASDRTLKQTWSLKDDVAEYAARPLRQEPGAKFEYNNCGIDTGGRIIEVVSGLPYADFMQQRLFDPLGMNDTTFWPTAKQAKRLARSARFNADKTGLEEVKLDKELSPALIERLGHGVTAPPELLSDFGMGKIPDYAHHFAEPAGGLFSTASDLGRFCRMLLNGGVDRGKRYLSQQAIRQMTSVQTGNVPVNPQEAYGLGWFVKIRADEGPSVGSFGHRGARRPVMWVDPNNGLALLLLVERFDMPGDGQKALYGSFLKAAIERYGRPPRWRLRVAGRLSRKPVAPFPLKNSEFLFARNVTLHVIQRKRRLAQPGLPLDRLGADEASDLVHWRRIFPHRVPLVELIFFAVLARRDVHHRIATERKGKPRRRVLGLPMAARIVRLLPEPRPLPLQGVAFLGFDHGKSDGDLVPGPQVGEYQVPVHAERRGGLVVDLALDGLLIDPPRNADRDRLRGLVPNDHFAFVGQIAVDVKPLRGAVQQQVDLCCALVIFHDAVPCGVESHGGVARAANDHPEALPGDARGPAIVGQIASDEPLAHVARGVLDGIDRGLWLVRLHGVLGIGAGQHRPTRDRLLQLFQFGHLSFGQLVADILIDILPIIAHALAAEPDGQVGHIAGGAHLAEQADAGNAEVPQVLIPLANEFHQPRVMGHLGVAEQAHQASGVAVNVAHELAVFVAHDGLGRGLRRPELLLHEEILQLGIQPAVFRITAPLRPARKGPQHAAVCVRLFRTPAADPGLAVLQVFRLLPHVEEISEVPLDFQAVPLAIGQLLDQAVQLRIGTLLVQRHERHHHPGRGYRVAAADVLDHSRDGPGLDVQVLAAAAHAAGEDDGVGDLAPVGRPPAIPPLAKAGGQERRIGVEEPVAVGLVMLLFIEKTGQAMHR
jgi:CubicO group peptidase (beta-lactamase class C family)